MESSVPADLALDYLDTVMAECVLGAGAAVKTADVAREVGERLGASARLVRNELGRSSRLCLVDRRWDLKARHEHQRRSVDGGLQYLLREYGRPLALAQMARELALVRNQKRDDMLRVVHTMVATRDTYFMTPDGLVGLREWLLDVRPGDDDQMVRVHSFFQADVDLDGACERLDLAAARLADSTLDGLVALAESVDEPVGSRVLLYALWRARGEIGDVEALFSAASRDPRLELMSGPSFANQRYLQNLRGMLADLSSQHDADATVAEPVDVQEVIEGDVALDEEFDLSSDDVQEIQRIISESGHALPLPNLVSDVFELFPGDLQYLAALKAVNDSLKSDDRFVDLPDHRWHLRVLLPPTLYRVPVTLQLSPIQVTTLTGEAVDGVLSDSGLEGGLQYEVRAWDLEDIGEEDEVPELREGMVLAKRQRFVTSYRHFVSGTVKVRRIDRGVFPLEPEVRPIRLKDASSNEEFELWLNNGSGLLCGLDEWYKGRLQPAGSVFYLERLDDDLWVAELDPEIDAVQSIPQPRLDELLVLRVRIEHAQEVSVLEIMRQLMEKHPGGVSFRRLYTECNIVRRVAKRVIASNLSSYPMFSLNDDETLWLYDERKAARPRDAAKRAFLAGGAGD